ncbi:hypothetical protein HK096_005010 [Nowakowskiella sp. JEL0078]|nr:hypothetical protein HK096_005010 [Nowakowskiella sp. JEL0078]
MNDSKSSSICPSSQSFSQTTQLKPENNPNNNKTLYDELREECQDIEEHMRQGEFEVMRREEDAFLAIKFEQEISTLQSMQAAELREKKNAFKKMCEARVALQKAKRMQKQLFRDVKKRDSIIMQQEESIRATRNVQLQLSERSKMFEKQLAFVEDKHEKQRKQLIAAQDRTINYETTLHDLETQNLKSEMRSALAKQFLGQITHQKALDKRIIDQQRETQLLELRHLKEHADLEERAFEETSTLEISHSNRHVDVKFQQVSEMHIEKDRMNDMKQSIKLSKIESEFAAETKKIVISQRNQLRLLKQQQTVTMKNRKVRGNKDTSNDQQEQQQSVTHSTTSTRNSARTNRTNPRQLSRHNSAAQSVDSLGGISDTESIGSELDLRNSTTQLKTPQRGLQYGISVSEDDEHEEKNVLLSPELAGMMESIKRLAARQKESLETLKKTQREELERCRKQWTTRIREMEEEQEAEMVTLKEAHEKEIGDLFAAQEREIQMEAAVNDTELKMLMERRLLNSVLDGVVDAIITIDPIGTIKRFNFAAEQMFGYKASEVIEENIRDLMPEEYSSQHDSYLKNYMTTGIKKVIGRGRRAMGMRKDRSVFPLHLSVSEVKNDGVHLFTGIVRNMTSEVESERMHDEITVEMQKKQNDLELLLDTWNEKTKNIQTLFIPTLQNENFLECGKIDSSITNCSVLSTEVCCEFEKLAPTECLEIANKIHTLFLSTATKYDVNFIDVSATQFLIVAGINANVEKHAIAIGSLALDLLSDFQSLKEHINPNISIDLKMGGHSGSK